MDPQVGGVGWTWGDILQNSEELLRDCAGLKDKAKKIWLQDGGVDGCGDRDGHGDGDDKCNGDCDADSDGRTCPHA